MVAALDTNTGKTVAIKKIKNIFEDVVKAKRILREIKLLRHFGKHENIVTILDIMSYPPESQNLHDVYIVCNLMESDLDQILRSPQPLSNEHDQYFLYQILRGLKYIHSANVVHRDLKPSNLLVNASCDLALCDFGLSRGVDNNDGLTEYVVTRWYRAPELLCEARSYGKSVDIWSVGCIFGETLGRKPLFQGKSPHHQLAIILSTLGCPPIQECSFAPHTRAKIILEQAQNITPKGLRTLLPETVSDDAFDLLSKMLVVKPEDRITVADALEHKYLSHLHRPKDEPICDSTFDNAFEDESQGESISMLKTKLEELMLYEVQNKAST